MEEKMPLKKAEEIAGKNRATWELNNMKKALEIFPILNTPEENERLQAVKIVLNNRRKMRRVS